MKYLLTCGDQMNHVEKILLLVVLAALSMSCREKKVDFSAQVKPILNKRCISCHGGVKRNGGFSVLFRKDALDTTESGKHGIVPGDPAHSEMIRRITSTDPEVRMPYKEPPLPQAEIEILRRWIQEGAPWGDHWAYVPPKAVPVPKTATAGMFSDDEWAQNEIDYFILEKLQEQGMTPSPPADKALLLRRVYLDLIGLPPTEQQAAAFFNDDRPDAYEKVVDDLLASPHFGEKWASWWLDLARYSDTKGYERDAGRTIWKYRDWVIRAFNRDMPFDQFSIEQLAGDLLPNPSDDQLIATAFNRNTMNNDEGGTDDEEFRVAAVLDRVGTTWEVWQSTTMRCVQCHTHPYDPFVHEDFYKSYAFFNNTRDEDTDGEHPNLRSYDEEDQQKLERLRKWIREQAGPEEEQAQTLFLKTLEPKYYSHDFDTFVNGELVDTKWLGIRPGGSARLPKIRLDGKTRLFLNYWTGDEGGSVEVRMDRINGEVICRGALPKTKGRITTALALAPREGIHDLYFIFRNPGISPQTAVCRVDWFAFRNDLPGKGDPAYPEMNRDFNALLNSHVDKTPVMIESGRDRHRATYVFERGNWLTPGEEVQPDVPESLNPFPEGAPYNRLGFAQWLFSKDNPLTARTTVNRLWEQIFGTGIVETLEDFGTQGAAPSHPELLDWLALHFMNDLHWSVKKMLKDIVMSAAYCQDSHVTEEHLMKDAANRYLARAPRLRLSAEQIRDQALAVSGLLSGKMFGKSVMPYQPAGVWATVYNGEKWKNSQGEDRYRRSVYTYAKRTSPYPEMMMFDGSSREVCVSRRIRTNTPLQALVTLNDSSFVVAARHFAVRMKAGGSDVPAQIRNGYRRLLLQDIPETKLRIFTTLYSESLAEYRREEQAARKLTASSDGSPELAAMTIVANAMLNLDEVIMRE